MSKKNETRKKNKFLEFFDELDHNVRAFFKIPKKKRAEGTEIAAPDSIDAADAAGAASTAPVLDLGEVTREVGKFFERLRADAATKMKEWQEKQELKKEESKKRAEETQRKVRDFFARARENWESTLQKWKEDWKKAGEEVEADWDRRREKLRQDWERWVEQTREDYRASLKYQTGITARIMFNIMLVVLPIIVVVVVVLALLRPLLP